MSRSRAGRALCAMVVGLTALAGCASGDADDGAVPTSAPTNEATPSSSAPAPSTTVTGDRCAGGDAVPPEGAEDVSEVSADVDGNGSADRVLAYRRSDGGRRVAVELAAGGTAAVDAGASEIEGPAPLSVLGGVDLGGGGDTVFAITGAGASVVVVGLFQFVECALARVELQSGQPVELPVGGGITHGDGLSCDGDILTALRATSVDGETFRATDTSYQVDGNTLIEVGSQTATLTRPADGGEIDDYYTIDCPTLDNSLGKP